MDSSLPSIGETAQLRDTLADRLHLHTSTNHGSDPVEIDVCSRHETAEL